MTIRHIPNSALVVSLLPGSATSWDEIQRFALTFDGYEHCGSSEACAAVANARKADSLSDLRTCLFYEQRRWRHFGEEPDTKAMTYIKSVLEQIRDRVALANSCQTTK